MKSGRHNHRPGNYLFFFPRLRSTWDNALPAADLAALLDFRLRRTLDALRAAFLPVVFLGIAITPFLPGGDDSSS